MADNKEQSGNTENPDEFLAAVQGEEQVIVNAQKTDEGKEKTEEEEEGKPPVGNEEEEEEKSQLSQEEFDSVSSEINETLASFTEDADEETKEIKKGMLSLFKDATDFDSEGNLIDKDGNQVATYDELVNKIGQQEDAIFDSAGNQVDKEGKVVATKLELDIAESPNNAIGKKLGYEFEDQNGNLKLYKEGEAGLEELVNDIAEYKLQESQQDFFNSNPVLREVAKHLLSGGQLEDFQKPVDYGTIELSKMSLSEKKALVKQSYIADGVSDTRAENIVNNIADDKLDSQVQDALDVLETKQEAKVTERAQLLEQQEAVRKEDNRKYWNEVENTIKQGKLDDINIPEKDREAFFKYLAIPVKGGQSQDQIDREERELSGELKEAYYRFKGYNVSDIIQEEVSRNKVLSIRQKIQKKAELNQSSKPHVKGNVGEISLDTII